MGQQEILDESDWYGKKLHVLERLCLMDDSFMTVVFSDNIEATELLLKILLEDDAISVRQVVTQKEIKNPYGRSVKLDISAVDSAGRQFDVEVQKSDHGAVPQRARYNRCQMSPRFYKRRAPSPTFGGWVYNPPAETRRS